MKHAFFTICFLLVFLVFSIVAMTLGHKPLVDPDIGWHLIGGLWILAEGHTPALDMITYPFHEWWCYSWLAEVLFAYVFTQGGFEALQSLQTLLIVLSTWSLSLLVYCAARASRSSIALLLCLALAVFLTASVWHLRPQLISIILFAILLLLREKELLRWYFVLPLGILWANIHVYWLLIPLVLALNMLLVEKRVNKKNAGLILVAASLGLFTPYGVDHYLGLFSYAFSHNVANEVVKEFKPLFEGSRLLFALVTISLLGALSGYKQLRDTRRADLWILSIILGGAAIWQLKFVPLFGVAVPCVLARLAPHKPQFDIVLTRKDVLSICAGIVVLLLVAGTLLTPGPVLDPKRQQTLNVGEVAFSKLAQNDSNPVVFNIFGDGGWLRFSFWIAQMKQKTDRSLFTSIDGRTLVMGPERLQAYRVALQSRDTMNEYLETIAARGIIIPNEESYRKLISPEHWTLVFENEHRLFYCATEDERCVVN